MKRVKKNNKGFSLVELIVVIAIMAVLMGVLAPQFLKYVARARLQRDNSAITEIANAIKIASADQSINDDITDGDTIVADTTTTNTYVFSATSTDLLIKELNATVGTPVTLNSSKYATAPTLTVHKSSAGVVTVTVSLFSTPDETTATAKTY